IRCVLPLPASPQMARRWLGQSGVRASQVSAAVLLGECRNSAATKRCLGGNFNVNWSVACTGLVRTGGYAGVKSASAAAVARRSQRDDAPVARRVATAGAQQTVGAACCADVFREVATPAILTGLHRSDREHFAFVASRGIVPGFAVAAQLVLEGLLDPIDAQAQGAVRQRWFSAGVADELNLPHWTVPYAFIAADVEADFGCIEKAALDHRVARRAGLFGHRTVNPPGGEPAGRRVHARNARHVASPILVYRNRGPGCQRANCPYGPELHALAWLQRKQQRSGSGDATLSVYRRIRPGEARQQHIA